MRGFERNNAKKQCGHAKRMTALLFCVSTKSFCPSQLQRRPPPGAVKQRGVRQIPLLQHPPPRPGAEKKRRNYNNTPLSQDNGGSCGNRYYLLQQKYPPKWAGIFAGAAGQIRTAGCLPLRGCIRTDPPACAGSTCPPGTGRQFEYPGDAKNPRPRWGHGFSGAAGQIRTADLILTKDALYRLSYSSILAPWKEGARCVATEMGLEPTTSSVTG